MADRAENERRSYDEGEVYARSRALMIRFEHAFNCPNARHAEAYWRAQLERCVPGAAVLELGCFDGNHLEACRRLGPARLVGIDVSGVQVEKARARGLDARVMDAQRLAFDDREFDVVIGRAILHHLDFERSLREVHRVLRPGGTALFIEPLRDNPAWKLFRLLTPGARTHDELPLSRGQIEWADRLFGTHRHCFSGLLSTALGAATSLTPLRADNLALRLADRVDRRIARSALRYWMAQAVLVWERL